MLKSILWKSTTLIAFIFIFWLNGSVPIIKGSKILFSSFDGKPELGSIATKFMPEGTRKGILFELPNGTAKPEKYLNAITFSLLILQCLI